MSDEESGEESGFAWLNRYVRPFSLAERRPIYDRYQRTLSWLAEWESRPDSGYFHLWHDICFGDDTHEE